MSTFRQAGLFGPAATTPAVPPATTPPDVPDMEEDPAGRAFVGLDLGQSQDYSAAVVLRRIPVPGRPKPDYYVPLVKRWPLGTSYVSVVDNVVRMFDSPRLAGHTLVLDITGCGRPVYDMILEQQPQCHVVGVLITGGAIQHCVDGIWHVSKTILVAATKLPFQQRRIKFADKMPLVGVLVKELESYRMQYSLQANEIYAAKDSEHDDIVMGLALSCWAAENNSRWAPRIHVLGDAVQDPQEASDEEWARNRGYELHPNARSYVGQPANAQDEMDERVRDAIWRGLASGRTPTAHEIDQTFQHNQEHAEEIQHRLQNDYFRRWFGDM